MEKVVTDTKGTSRYASDNSEFTSVQLDTDFIKGILLERRTVLHISGMRDHPDLKQIDEQIKILELWKEKDYLLKSKNKF